MSAPLNIAQAADLVDLSIQNVYEKASEPTVSYPKYFNVRKTEDYYDKDSSLSGLGEADFVDENGIIISDVPVQGYKKIADARSGKPGTGEFLAEMNLIEKKLNSNHVI